MGNIYTNKICNYKDEVFEYISINGELRPILEIKVDDQTLIYNLITIDANLDDYCKIIFFATAPFYWNWGDGNKTLVESGVPIEHTYTSLGIYKMYPSSKNFSTIQLISDGIVNINSKYISNINSFAITSYQKLLTIPLIQLGKVKNIINLIGAVRGSGNLEDLDGGLTSLALEGSVSGNIKHIKNCETIKIRTSGLLFADKNLQLDTCRSITLFNCNLSSEKLGHIVNAVYNNNLLNGLIQVHGNNGLVDEVSKNKLEEMKNTRGWKVKYNY
jgi:hypothetical protein